MGAYMNPDNTSTIHANGNISEAYTSGTWRAPQGYKDLLHFVLLIIVTLGFYNLFWIYHMTEYTNADETHPKRNPTAQLLLFLVPFYGLYWYWITAKKLSNMGESVGLHKDYSVLATILPFLTLGFIASTILQNQFNQFLCVKAGASINATGQSTCKNCKATFPNDATQCPNCGVQYKGGNLRKSITYIIIVLYTLLSLLITSGNAIRFYDNQFKNNAANTTSDIQISSDVQETTPSSTLATTTAVKAVTRSNTSNETISSADANSVAAVSRPVSTLKQGADGKWGMYYDDGSLDRTFEGLAQNKDTGDWYAIEDGYVSWNFTGIAKNEDMEAWFLVEKGKVNFDISGEYSEEGTSITIEKGKVMKGTFVTEGGRTVTINNGVETS